MSLTILELLAQPGVGNLMLLLAAIVGVGGSFVLYWKKKRDQKRNLRLALKEELEAMETFFEVELEELERTPDHRFLSTKVYEKNTEKLGMLSEEELSEIVRFYSAAEQVEEFVEWRSSIKMQIASNPNLKNIPEGVNKEILEMNLESLKSRWKKAKEALETE